VFIGFRCALLWVRCLVLYVRQSRILGEISDDRRAPVNGCRSDATSGGPAGGSFHNVAWPAVSPHGPMLLFRPRIRAVSVHPQSSSINLSNSGGSTGLVMAFTSGPNRQSDGFKG
jgi:hypothetical protein